MTPARVEIAERRSWTRRFPPKIIPQLDRYPLLVGFVQTPAGKAAALAVFGLLLLLDSYSRPFWPVLTAIAAVMSFLPRYRRELLTLSTAGWLLFNHSWIDTGLLRRIAAAEALPAGWTLQFQLAAVLILVFVSLGVVLRAVRLGRPGLLARRPVLVIVCCYFILLVCAGALPLHGSIRLAAWMFVAVLGPYLWYFAYAAADQHSKQPDSYFLQFGTFYPFWRAPLVSPTPIGKGATYLRKTEARTPRELAVTQLKAIKLLLWLLVLSAVLHLIRAMVHGDTHNLFARLFHALHMTVPALALPTLPAALDRVAAGLPLPAPVAWASMISRFIEEILGLAIAGNTVVACCRMAGFNILRNTYKPVYATSIADFWNRYYYYFKELLVDMFFFPAYTRYFKKHRRLRLAAATVAAATIGNMLYHFGRDFHFVFELGLWKALVGYQVYAFYTVVLGCGIVFSQLRAKRTASASTSLGGRIFTSGRVLAFYALLGVFAEGDRAHPLATHFSFLMHLLPLGW